jgi:hypothetical protein
MTLQKQERAAMFSSSLNISEFFDQIKGHSYQEIIQMTDREATAVERLYYKTSQDKAEYGNIERYAGCLKDFILYMRHGIKTRKLRDLNLTLFQQVRLDR